MLKLRIARNMKYSGYQLFMEYEDFICIFHISLFNYHNVYIFNSN